LGVDGSASNDAGNLIAEARMALLLQRVARGADAMSAREALEIATLGGARVLGRDDVGSIEVGKLADFVVLSKDPTAVDPDTLDELKVTETIKEGVSVFVLTPAEQGRTDMMLGPNRGVESGFSRFLRVTTERNDPHADGTSDLACYSSAILDLTATLAGAARMAR
jgi:hypothetical protein